MNRGLALTLAIASTTAASCGRVGFDAHDDANTHPDSVSIDADPADARPTPDASLGELVSVPAGAFWMGCNSGVDAMCSSDEFAYRQVTLSAFQVMRTEVSQAQYDACVQGAGCSQPFCSYTPQLTPDLPVLCVSWQQASDYCQWRGMRLPTEAEWEKAARGTDGRIYPWGNQAPNCTLANLTGCPGDAASVTAYAATPSPYGTLNMSGNVWEWVADWYDANYYNTAPTTDPPGPPTGTLRVSRGGSYSNTEILLRASNRWSEDPSSAPSNYGIRCVQ